MKSPENPRILRIPWRIVRPGSLLLDKRKEGRDHIIVLLYILLFISLTHTSFKIIKYNKNNVQFSLR